MTSDFMKWAESNIVPIIKKNFNLGITPDTMIYADTWETNAERYERMTKSKGTADPWLAGWITLEDEYGNTAEFRWRKIGKKIIVEKESGWKKDFWGVKK